MQLKELQILTVLLFFISIRFDVTEGQQLVDCNRTFSCGEQIRGVGYPFWGGDRAAGCGLCGLELSCRRRNCTTIDIDGEAFVVRNISNNTNSLKIARIESIGDVCPEQIEWSNLLFRFTPNVEILTLLYTCSSINPTLRNISTCRTSEADRVGFIVDESFSPAQIPNRIEDCEWNVTIPVLKSAMEEFRRNDTKTLREVLNEGFEVEYDHGVVCPPCGISCGSCVSANSSDQPPSCISQPDEPGSGLNLGLKIGIGVGAAAVSASIMCMIFLIYHHRYRKHHTTSSFISHGSSSSYPSLTKDLEKAGVHIFDYYELDEATDRFNPKRELGDGGYGAVYKGKLHDGRTVAVKRLYENHNKRVEQFMNEVAILTRMRHQNLVTLYGCTPGNSRELLLVYEYIPNGTLADHLHGLRAKPGSLSWITRLNIAVETASALAYLHASDVIHRDVKTTNILLDNNFIVKVADFGLSRLLPMDATHVSTAPQGTPGYVDPEYSESYQLTEKSDVYSFGVVLIELISSKPAVDITRHRYEINLSSMAVNKIQKHALHELVDPNLGFDSDYEVRTMIVSVAELAFQCLQSGRDLRPHMQQVLNDLQEIQTRVYNTTKDVMDISPPNYNSC